MENQSYYLEIQLKKNDPIKFQLVKLNPYKFELKSNTDYFNLLEVLKQWQDDFASNTNGADSIKDMDQKKSPEFRQSTSVQSTGPYQSGFHQPSLNRKPINNINDILFENSDNHLRIPKIPSNRRFSDNFSQISKIESTRKIDRGNQNNSPDLVNALFGLLNKDVEHAEKHADIDIESHAGICLTDMMAMNEGNSKCDDMVNMSSIRTLVVANQSKDKLLEQNISEDKEDDHVPAKYSRFKNMLEKRKYVPNTHDGNSLEEMSKLLTDPSSEQKNLRPPVSNPKWLRGPF